jgi:hypothetical protein
MASGGASALTPPPAQGTHSARNIDSALAVATSRPRRPPTERLANFPRHGRRAHPEPPHLVTECSRLDTPTPAPAHHRADLRSIIVG